MSDKMISKDYKNFSNSELKLHKLNLVNEYEAIKAKIKALEDELDRIDLEYVKITNEENARTIR